MVNRKSILQLLKIHRIKIISTTLGDKYVVGCLTDIYVVITLALLQVDLHQLHQHSHSHHTVLSVLGRQLGKQFFIFHEIQGSQQHEKVKVLAC